MDAKKAHELVEDFGFCTGEQKEKVHGLVEAITGEKGDGVIPFDFSGGRQLPHSSTWTVRDGGEYAKRAIYLGVCRDWRILIDNKGASCFVCFEKGKAPRRSDV